MNTVDHFRALTRLSNAELEKILAASDGPDPKDLAGWEFSGFNVASFTKWLGIQKFIKGFFQGPAYVEGYNIPVRQNGFDAPWEHLPSAESPKRFGYYLARRVGQRDRDNKYPRAVLLNYGASPRNIFVRPERVLRDYLVVPDPNDRDLLLGKAYLAIGAARVFSNFFVLKRLRPAAWKA
jgi:hypothetical protein